MSSAEHGAAVIFHIAPRTGWEAALRAGSYEPPSLTTEGFIHCSTQEQVVDTANLRFRGQDGLVLLCIEPAQLTAAVRYEAPATQGHSQASGGLFPHVYGPVNLDAVTQVLGFAPRADGSFAMRRELGG